MSYGVRSWQCCAVAAPACAVILPALAQRAGQSASVGLMSASGKSSSKKARNVIVGAVEKASAAELAAKKIELLCND